MKSQKNATPKYLGATGASAGGLDALSKLLQGLPEEKLSLSILEAQHLSPSHRCHKEDLPFLALPCNLS